MLCLIADVEIICSEDKDFKEKFMTLIQSCQVNIFSIFVSNKWKNYLC